MTKDEIKAKLNSYLELQGEKSQLEEEIEKLEILSYSPRSPNTDGSPHGSGISDPTASNGTRISDLRDFYKKKIDEITAVQLEIEKMIGVLSPTERKLIRYRYIDGLKWEAVCIAMNYSWRNVHIIHGKALVNLTLKSYQF